MEKHDKKEKSMVDGLEPAKDDARKDVPELLLKTLLAAVDRVYEKLKQERRNDERVIEPGKNSQCL